MILERAEFTAKAGKGDELEVLLTARGPALTGQYTGCISFKTMRCVEYPDTFMFLAEWVSIEAHHESRHEPAHIEFREMLLPFAASARETVHFTLV